MKAHEAQLSWGEVFGTPADPARFVLRLEQAVADPAATLADYVLTPQAEQALGRTGELMGRAITNHRDRGVLLSGRHGAGRTHLLAVLDLLLSRHPAASDRPDLQASLGGERALESAQLLSVPCSLAGADSLGPAVFRAYLSRVAQVRPGSSPALLRRTDKVFREAERIRSRDQAEFFDRLNSDLAGREAHGATGAADWTPASYDSAAGQPIGDPQREALAAALVTRVLRSDLPAGSWLDLHSGLRVMDTHAAALGFTGIVLLIDDAGPWPAQPQPDPAATGTRVAKLAQLVERDGASRRSLPLLSVVALTCETDEPGPASEAVGTGRFKQVVLKTSDLPAIARRRLLTPRGPRESEALAAAADRYITGPGGDGPGALGPLPKSLGAAQLHPFPAPVVQVMLGLAGLLQGEVNVLSAMAQILRDGAQRPITQRVTIGEAFETVLAQGWPPPQHEVARGELARVEAALGLYQEQLLPAIVRSGASPEAAPSAKSPDPGDRWLAATVVAAAMLPTETALHPLTPTRLAELNPGAIQVIVPGMEASLVLARVRGWAASVPGLSVAGGADPQIKLAVPSPTEPAVLAMVGAADTPSARQRHLAEAVRAAFALPADASEGHASIAMHWRATKRNVEILLGHLADESEVPPHALLAGGGNLKVAIDYPVVAKARSDTASRIDSLRSRTTTTTLVWAPLALSDARMADLGTLARIDHLLAGPGENLDSVLRSELGHVPRSRRDAIREDLLAQRGHIAEHLAVALRQAYGLAPADPADVRIPRQPRPLLVGLDPVLALTIPPVDSLAEALAALCRRAWDLQFPDHLPIAPDEPAFRRADLAAVLEAVRAAVQVPGGRLGGLDPDRLALLDRVATPLRCGIVAAERYVFDASSFPWRDTFAGNADRQSLTGSVPVERIRAWLQPVGLSPDMSALLILAWAALEDKQFARSGRRIRVKDLTEVSDDLVLVDPELPDEETWRRATATAAALFGIPPPPRRTAVNVTRLAGDIRGRAGLKLTDDSALADELERRSGSLRLHPQSNRMRSARVGADITAGLAAPDDDSAVLTKLAGIELPESTKALAHSIATAPAVLAKLRKTPWEAIEEVDSAPPDANDSALGAAQAAISELRRAAAADELEQPLAPALDAAAKLAEAWRSARDHAGGRRSATGGPARVQPATERAIVPDRPWPSPEPRAAAAAHAEAGTPGRDARVESDRGIPIRSGSEPTQPASAGSGAPAGQPVAREGPRTGQGPGARQPAGGSAPQRDAGTTGSLPRILPGGAPVEDASPPVAAADVPARLAEIAQEIERALARRPDRKVRISWRLD